jgi:hypothetical protein
MKKTLFRPLFIVSVLSAIVVLNGCSSSTSPSSSGNGGGLDIPVLNFGVVPVGQMRDTTIVFFNSGNDTVTITGDALSSPAAQDFNFTSPVSIAPDQYKNFTFQFTPSATVSVVTDSIHYQAGGKNYIALMTIEANAGNGGGTGTGSLLAIPANINFGTLPVGVWHDTTITLVNSGTGIVTILTNTLSSGEAQDTNFSRPIQIPSQSLATIHLQFNPAQAGARSATDQINYTSGGKNASITITLSATGATGVTSSSPKPGSSFTYAVDTNGVPQGDSTYTVVSNSLPYQGKTNVLEVSGPTGALNYSHVESNGDVSVYVDLSSVSAQLISAGIFAVIPSQWITIPLGSKHTLSNVLFDSTLTITGIPFPVQVIISDTSLYLGSSSVTAAGKSFQTNEGSISLAINASVGGFVTLLSADQTTEIWYSNSLGYYPKRQDVSSNTQNTTGTGGTTTTTTTNYKLVSYHEN